MSVFGNFFGDSLETKLTAEFVSFNNLVDRVIESENALLRSVGIEPPRLVSAPRLVKEKEGRDWISVYVTRPSFEYPPHHQFFIRDNIVITFSNNLDSLLDMYSVWGLNHVINDNGYGDIWTNRCPFSVYRQLENMRSGSTTYKRDQEFIFQLKHENEYIR
jgi:hypothetical protein